MDYKQGEQKLFSHVFYYITENFCIRAKQLCDAFPQALRISEHSIYSWKTRTAPRPDNFSQLKNILSDMLERKNFELYLTEEAFLQAMDGIFDAYGLTKKWALVKKQPISYLQKLEQALELSYAYRKLHVGAPSQKSKADEPRKITRLVVFDADGTLLKGIKYSWTVLYEAVNLSTEKCHTNKKKFERGEISYLEWVDYDCMELRQAGLTREIAYAAAREKCTLTKNFYEAIAKLKAEGFAVALVSGGADAVLYAMIPDADEVFDGNIFINRLRFDERSGILRKIDATPYDWDDGALIRGVVGKHAALRMLCEKYNLDLKDSVFVGDDDNDFKAMSMAGLCVVYAQQGTVIGGGVRSLQGNMRILMHDNLMDVAKIILDYKPQ